VGQGRSYGRPEMADLPASGGASAASRTAYPVVIGVGASAGGVEALGQNMLIIVAYSAVLGAGLALPGMLGLLVFALLRNEVGWWALVPGVAVLLTGLAVEAAVLLRWLGRAFEATDPAGAEIPA